MDTLRTQSGLPPSRIDFLDEVAKTCSEQKFFIVLNEIPVKIEKQIVLEQLQKFGEMENIEILFNSDWLGRFQAKIGNFLSKFASIRLLHFILSSRNSYSVVK